MTASADPRTADDARPEFSWPAGETADSPEPAHARPWPVGPLPTSRAGDSRRTGRARTVALLAAASVAAGATGSALTMRYDGDSSPAVPITRSATVLPVGTEGTSQTAAATVAPSVVTIAVSGSAEGQNISGTGSGVVLRQDGYIVTNNHVVAAATGGGRVSVRFSDGSTRPARIVGTDPTSDLAVVRVNGAADLTAATFADSDALAVGQAVLAVGAPLGLANTVTQGIVSTLHRPVRTGQNVSAQSVIDAVQTDAAINPGNSGGALVDLAGRVVGIPSAIATAGRGASGNIGVGFAIPSNDATEVAEELIRDGRATHAQIGVSVSDAAESAEGLGASVGAVTAGGPAAAAGLRDGDVVTRVGGRDVTDADGLIVAVRSREPGEQVEVTYRRDGQTRTATISLGTAPAR